LPETGSQVRSPTTLLRPMHRARERVLWIPNNLDLGSRRRQPREAPRLVITHSEITPADRYRCHHSRLQNPDHHCRHCRQRNQDGSATKCTQTGHPSKHRLWCPFPNEPHEPAQFLWSPRVSIFRPYESHSHSVALHTNGLCGSRLWGTRGSISPAFIQIAPTSSEPGSSAKTAHIPSCPLRRHWSFSVIGFPWQLWRERLSFPWRVPPHACR
jgi:hypothetical protein